MSSLQEARGKLNQAASGSTSTTTDTTATAATTASTTTTTTTTTPAPHTDTSSKSVPDPYAHLPVKAPGAVCRGKFEFLRCSRGTKVRVTSALYGRRGSADGRCRGFSRSSSAGCSMLDVSGVLGEECDGKTGCWVYHGVVERNLGDAKDPCPGVAAKYIEVKYVCDDGKKKKKM